MDLIDFLCSNYSWDPRIEETQGIANAAASSASFNARRLARLAEVLERRFQEVERDNALLGSLLVRVLDHLSNKDPQEMEALTRELRDALAPDAAAAASANHATPTPGMSALRQKLGLTEARKTPVATYTKPKPGPRPSSGGKFPPPAKPLPKRTAPSARKPGA